MKILYLASGGPRSTSIMKAQALERLGHDVQVINLNECHPANVWRRRFNNWTGYIFLAWTVGRFIASRVNDTGYDVAWVDSGPMVGPAVVEQLRLYAPRVINYNHDDPTGNRDGRAWRSFRKAIPFYDLMVTVRSSTEAELKARGARRTLRVWMSFDEIEHRARPISAADRAKWGSEVVFVGSWMPERGPFLAQLMASGVPLAIYGDFWSKAKEWPALRPAWRGPAVYGEDYAKAIQCSKVALGLLSKGNRDAHTTRSSEVPALGGLLCAERTAEHQQLLVENKEAVFWSDPAECATACLGLLQDDGQREQIRAAGHARVWADGPSHQRMLSLVLEKLLRP